MLDRLEQALATSARHHLHGALMLIDMDNFKTLNDTLGHDIGDQLLVAVAARLQSCVREGDTVARMGGDEFVVILEDLDETGLAAMQAESVSRKILEQLSEPYVLDLGQTGNNDDWPSHHCSSSIGIALFLDDPVTVDELMKRADTAMYRAKAAGRNTLRFFDPEMQAVVTERAVMEAALRKAIADRQFQLHYQAQLDSSGRVFGAEALLRWQHPERGMVAPASFIPLSEENGLILPLGQWVLETACRQLADWAAHPETASLMLSVNVSVRQFRCEDFVSQVLAALDHSGANPERLKLELTETLLVEDMDDVIGKMTALKARGVGFSLDDFGTGYSSLAYLKRLPFDELKIDKSFVRDVLADANDAAISRTIVALGQTLGFAVIAEGVETEAQREFLASIGCYAYQGFFFSRPLSSAEFEEFVKRNGRVATDPGRG
jgi:diguanylate cyclase (GGDEF)-like protein